MTVLRIRAWGLVLALAALSAGAGASELAAERIDRESAERLVVGGPDAIGGIGDWALRNGTLCAVVADPGHESDLATTGGGLVDLAHCGRKDDQFLLYQELLNSSLDDPVPYREVAAEADARSARVTVRGGRDGLAVRTRYALDLEEPRRLRIRSVVTREAGEAELSGYAAALANVRGLTPFNLSLGDPRASRGYVHPTFRDRGLGALSEAASPSEVVIAVGAEELAPGVAYGQRLVSARLETGPEAGLGTGKGETVPLPHFFLSDALATTLAAFAEPFWIGDGSHLGWLQLLQARFLDLPEEAALVLEQEIWVGDRADAASVTDLLWPDAPLLEGRVDAPHAAVHVDRASGAPLTQVRADGDGRFAARVPAGELRLRIRAPGRAPDAEPLERRVSLPEEGADVGLLETGAPARVRLPRIGPARLTFVGLEGTPAPDLNGDGRGFTLEGEEGAFRPVPPEPSVVLAGTERDPRELALPPGRYRVFANRGLEFTLETAVVEARAGGTAELALEAPSRAVSTPGWVAADFHVHAAPSLDNPTAPARQVAGFLAQGGEVLVSSDHEHVYDYAPLLRELGVEGRLASVVGLEVTSEVSTELAPHTIGHANAFPVPREPLAYRRGAVPNEGRRWRAVIADLRSLPGERVVQLNHPRFDEPGVVPRAFLSHMGPAAAPFEPGTPLDEPPNDVLVERHPETGLRDLDFDAIELMNGPHFESYERVREDWFALLRQGERLTGTANSDSHFLSRPTATPRTYVRLPSDDPAELDEDALVEAVREGRVYGSTGPTLELALGEAGLGETFRGREGRLRGVVRAPGWVPVSELRVYVSGERVATQPVARGEAFELPLAFERDAFVTVEVRSEPGEAKGGYAAVLPGYTPVAFTNPIWVDADADGEWRAPGL